MNKHTATCPNGQIVKRNSQNRTYSHVAVVFNVRDNKWEVLGWSSTEELARRNVDHKKSTVANYIKNGWYTGIYGDNPDCKIIKTNIA